MADKQIIIDGVDVSGCNLYRDEVSFIGGEIITDICSIWIWQRDYSGLEPSCVMKCQCKDNPNCDHKQKEKYKNALKEVKEIVEQGVKIHDDIIVSKQILQKIKECEI